MLIERQRPQPRAAAGEDVPCIGVSRVLDSDLGMRIDEQVGQEIKRVLRADGDQDLLGSGPDAAQRQYLFADLLDEERIITRELVLGPVESLGAGEHLLTAAAPLGRRKQCAVELPVDEWIGVLLPVSRLGDVTLKRGPYLQARGPVGSIGRRPWR